MSGEIPRKLRNERWQRIAWKFVGSSSNQQKLKFLKSVKYFRKQVSHRIFIFMRAMYSQIIKQHTQTIEHKRVGIKVLDISCMHM